MCTYGRSDYCCHWRQCVSKKNGLDSFQDRGCAKVVVNIAELVAEGHQVVVTHGNGPRWFWTKKIEIANEVAGMTLMPLVNCVADTLGGIGYQIQQALSNEFIRRGINKQVASVITQVEVSADDPNFKFPTKPVGSFFTLEQSEEMKKKHPEFTFVEDSGRGYRRVVPSPRPIDIVEKDAIKSLIDADFVVIAVGGGGIPSLKLNNIHMRALTRSLIKTLRQVF